MVTSKVNLIIAILMDLPDLFKSCNTKQRLLIKKEKGTCNEKTDKHHNCSTEEM